MDTLKLMSNYDIIDTGSVIIPNGEYAQFEIDSLIFRISFPCSEDLKQRLKIDMEEDDGGVEVMHVKSYNFQNSFFTTPSKILALANINGHQLYLNFSVTSVNNHDGNDDKLLFYTWLLEKQIAVEEKKGGDDE